GLIDRWARLASLAPGVANAIGRLSPARAVANALLHLQPERQLPEFAPQTFRARIKRRVTVASGFSRTSGEVLLWADTFTNYFQPHVAEAAYDVLASAGFRVRVLERHVCCGRP